MYCRKNQTSPASWDATRVRACDDNAERQGVLCLTHYCLFGRDQASRWLSTPGVLPAGPWGVLNHHQGVLSKCRGSDGKERRLRAFNTDLLILNACAERRPCRECAGMSCRHTHHHYLLGGWGVQQASYMKRNRCKRRCSAPQEAG